GFARRLRRRRRLWRLGRFRRLGWVRRTRREAWGWGAARIRSHCATRQDSTTGWGGGSRNLAERADHDADVDVASVRGGLGVQVASRRNVNGCRDRLTRELTPLEQRRLPRHSREQGRGCGPRKQRARRRVRKREALIFCGAVHYRTRDRLRHFIVNVQDRTGAPGVLEE